MKRVVQSRKIDTVFVMTVFCAFAASVLLVLMFGASAYKSIVEKSQEEAGHHTCLSYLWTKVKNADEAGKVYVGDFHGLPSLFLEEEYETTTFRTAIYLYDGWVCELFSENDLDFPPEAGTPVLEAHSLDYDILDDGLIRITVDSESLLIYPRGQSGLSSAG